MVKANAPKAPTGAAFISMATSLKKAALTDSRKVSTGLPRSPIMARAMPNRMETNSTCKMLPVENALTTVSGIMLVRKPMMVVSCAAWAYCDTAPASRLAGSILSPLPG
ncbi:hypothetical protein D3C72_494400 [compost metagenome]